MPYDMTDAKQDIVYNRQLINEIIELLKEKKILEKKKDGEEKQIAK